MLPTIIAWSNIFQISPTWGSSDLPQIWICFIFILTQIQRILFYSSTNFTCEIWSFSDWFWMGMWKIHSQKAVLDLTPLQVYLGTWNVVMLESSTHSFIWHLEKNCKALVSFLASNQIWVIHYFKLNQKWKKNFCGFKWRFAHQSLGDFHSHQLWGKGGNICTKKFYIFHMIANDLKGNDSVRPNPLDLFFQN